VVDKARKVGGRSFQTLDVCRLETENVNSKCVFLMPQMKSVDSGLEHGECSSSTSDMLYVQQTYSS